MGDQLLAYNIIGSENDLMELVENIQNQQLQAQYLQAIADDNLHTLMEIRKLVINHGVASEDEIDGAIGRLAKQFGLGQGQHEQEGNGLSWAQWARTPQGIATLGAGLAAAGFGVLRYLRR